MSVLENWHRPGLPRSLAGRGRTVLDAVAHSMGQSAALMFARLDIGGHADVREAPLLRQSIDRGLELRVGQLVLLRMKRMAPTIACIRISASVWLLRPGWEPLEWLMPQSPRR